MNPGPGFVKGLMAKGLDHPQQLRLSPFTRHAGDQTDESGHGFRSKPFSLLTETGDGTRQCEAREVWQRWIPGGGQPTCGAARVGERPNRSASGGRNSAAV